MHLFIILFPKKEWSQVSTPKTVSQRSSSVSLLAGRQNEQKENLIFKINPEIVLQDL